MGIISFISGIFNGIIDHITDEDLRRFEDEFERYYETGEYRKKNEESSHHIQEIPKFRKGNE